MKVVPIIEARVRLNLAVFVMRHRPRGSTVSLLEGRVRAEHACRRGNPRPPLVGVQRALVEV
jgi:hypothetical protein